MGNPPAQAPPGDRATGKTNRGGFHLRAPHGRQSTTVDSSHETNLPLRATAELAALAAPHEEIPRLDLAAVAAAGGHAREADRILREDVCDRSDDGEAPMELSERTESIIRSHDWLTPREAAS